MPVSFFELASAPVRQVADRFEQKQTVRRRREKDASAACFLSDGVVIEVVIEAEQRQLKPILPRALPWHAPALQPNRVRIGCHVLLERRRQIAGAVRDLDGRTGFLIGEAREDVPVPSPIGVTMPSALTRTDVRRQRFEACVTGVIDCLAVLGRREDEPLPRRLAAQGGDAGATTPAHEQGRHHQQKIATISQVREKREFIGFDIGKGEGASYPKYIGCGRIDQRIFSRLIHFTTHAARCHGNFSIPAICKSVARFDSSCQ